MKNIIKLLFVFLIIAFIGCSDKPPGFRVSNERPEKANIQIKTVNNTININDVLSGIVTAYQDVPAGKVDVTAVIQSQSVSPSGSFNADAGNNYTIVLVNSTPPTIRIDKSDK